MFLIKKNYLRNLCCMLLYREVEDFARRLNSDWPERMQEILSLGQERRPVPISINDNGSTHRYTSMFSLLFLSCPLPLSTTRWPLF